jgi:hypothetical protein
MTTPKKSLQRVTTGCYNLTSLSMEAILYAVKYASGEEVNLGVEPLQEVWVRDNAQNKFVCQGSPRNVGKYLAEAKDPCNQLLTAHFERQNETLVLVVNGRSFDPIHNLQGSLREVGKSLGLDQNKIDWWMEVNFPTRQ